jgi:methionyl-tRNA formyltransferase
MRIGYFADGPWSHRALEKILKDQALSINFICARFDNPDSILKEKAAESGIPFLIHENINSVEFLKVLGQFDCDIYVSMSFNQIFRKEIIALTPMGIINCHAGKLPFYRGRNVLNWALINDEKDFGVTVHYVDVGVDTGDIIIQESYSIIDSDDYCTLLSRSYEYCADVLHNALAGLVSGKSTRTPQSTIHGVGFYCSQRKVGDEVLVWKQASREIFNFVRAICKPGPQARTYLAGNEIKINKVELISNAPAYKGIPGAVLKIDETGMLVKTTDSFVRVVEWSSDVKVRVGDRLV